MTRQYLYIIDPLSTLNPKTDTTLALVEEACRRGVKNYACELGDIFLDQGELSFKAAPIELDADYTKPPVYLTPKKAMKAEEFRVIFMRKDPPIDEHFWAALLLLRCYNPKKTLFINNPNSLLLANEKLFGLSIAPHYFPQTLVSSQKDILRDFIYKYKKVALKPLFGAGGSGVLVFDSQDKNINASLELLSANFSQPIIAQAYIPKAREGDKRILLLGGDPLGAVLRVPSSDDHRANFHAGGTPREILIDNRDQEIISCLKPHLKSLGLEFVGIDIIGGFLTEINVTSPTCLLEMEQLSGCQLRKVALDYIEKLII